MDTIIIVGGVLLLALCFGGLVFAIAKYGPDEKKMQEEERLAEQMLDEPVDDLDIVAKDVTVLTLRCGVKMEGIKQPKTVRNFSVTFLTDDGEKLEFSVEEEFYTSLNEGERGSLALLNGVIYDYVSDCSLLPTE